jgi:putative ABC transport system permease protein
MTSIALRSTVRSLSKSPALCLTVIGIMALTIGSCTAIFSLVKAVFLSELPYKTVDRIVVIRHSDAGTTETMGMWARDYLTYRDTTRSFDSVAAFTTEGYNLSNGSEPTRITCSRITANLLPILGVTPLRGRWFTDSEDQRGANNTVILSYDLWRGRFGSDPDVLGRTVMLDLKPHTVVGIMPESFLFPPQGLEGPLPMRAVTAAECLIPAGFSPAEMTLPAFTWIVLGKLKPEVTLGQARQDAAIAAERIWQSYPPQVQKEVKLRARVVPLREEITQPSRTPVLVFAGAVGFLLLIGCANVANLMLAKLHVRQREMAIRTALGARRGSLIAQLLIECVLLAACGGLIGIPFGFGILRFLLAFNTGNIPMLDQVRIDTVTLLFTVLCSVTTGILFGLAPALRAKDVDLATAIADGGRGTSFGLPHNKLRSTLVVLEIALAFVLLIGAGLLLRSFVKLNSVHPGFDSRNVMTFSVALPEEQYKTQVHVDQFVNNVLRSIHRSSAVMFAAAGTSLPIGPTDYGVFARPDAPSSVAGFKAASSQLITPDYLQALGIPLKRGRRFNDADNTSRVPVAIVNETMARQYWPDVDVIGKQLSWVTPVGIRVLTIVGVVGDVHQEGLAAPTEPTLYAPVAQSPLPTRNLVFAVRSAVAGSVVAAEIRPAVTEIDPALPIFALQPATELISHSVGRERFNMFVVTMFAAGAMVLAVLGLYAVITYSVIHSSHELGVRIALGATPGKILRMVMVQGCGYVAAGLFLGITAALSLTQFMRSMLFGIDGADGTTFTGVITLLAVVTASAIFVPAIRATKVDPIISLRHE